MSLLNCFIKASYFLRAST